MSDLPILILKAGETVPALKPRRGDFEDWFAERLGGPRARFTVVRPYQGDFLPPPRGFAGVIVTGASSSVTDDDGWIPEAAGWVLGASQTGVPILGVCFGHQLVADAFGGAVAKNPEGREMGTVKVELTPEGRADPLFEGLPEVLEVQATHEDAVLHAPEQAVRLAGNANSHHQSMAVGDHVRTVQFHPEFDAEVVRAYVDAREAAIVAGAEARGEDGRAFVEAIRASLHDTPYGLQILRNWHRRYVERA